MNLKTSAEVINDIISKWRKNSNYKYSQNICFCQNAIQNLPPFISPLQYENYEVPRFADRGSPPTLSNLSATIPFNIALFISIFIAHYNVALLKKAIDFRIDRGESQLFGSICRRIHSTYIRQRRLLPHSNQW